MTDRTGQKTLRADIVKCLSQGMTTRKIQTHLLGRSTPKSISTTIYHMRQELGLEADYSRGAPRTHFAYVLLAEPVDRFLRQEAAERGVTTSQLATLILERVATDALVDAVLDDEGGR